jgi:hypothetical protein
MKYNKRLKLSLCLIIQALKYEHVWECGGIVPPFLTSALDADRWSVSRFGRFSHRYPLDKRLGGPQSRSERSGREKNVLLLSGIKPRQSTRRFVATPTQLLRALFMERNTQKTGEQVAHKHCHSKNHRADTRAVVVRFMWLFGWSLLNK